MAKRDSLTIQPLCRSYTFSTRKAANKKAKVLRVLARSFGAPSRTTVKSKRKPSRLVYVVQSCVKRV